MSQIFSPQHYNIRTLVLLLCIILGLVSSRALISIATGLLLVNLILDVYSTRNLQQFVKHPFILAFAAIPIVILIYLPFSSSIKNGLSELWQKLPFLIIPLSVFALRKDNQMIRTLLSIFIVVMVTSATVVLLNYLGNIDYYTKIIKTGKAIPMPINHIRYSLMLSFAAMLSFHFYRTKVVVKWSIEPILYLVVALFLFIVIHVFSVRSGVLTLYLGAICYTIYEIFQTKKYLLGLIILSAVMAVPIVAYNTIPSFSSRIDYMKYDWQQFKKGNIGHNSDSRRLRSYQVGWKVAKANLPFGTGTGELQETVIQEYETSLPNVEDYNQKMPHNQFLWTLVELGIPGMLALLALLFIPLSRLELYKDPMFVILTLVMLTSLMVEATFETQMGITFHALFASLLIRKKMIT